MKRILCLLLTGTMLLSLCCCAPGDPAPKEQDAPPSEPLTVSAPEKTPTPAPSVTLAPTATAAPTCTPTPSPTATPEPTPTPAPTPKPRSVAAIVEEMAVYYARYGGKAEEKVASLLAEIEAFDPGTAQKWREIMDLWRALDERIEINKGVLPDGLPDTNELCIVVLGYQLNANGTMKDQLKNRLNVVVKSAKKYPNAWIVCTGGGTAAKKKSATEAGQMAAYLKKKGVDKARIITEKRSQTTAQNARYTYDILQRDHPEIKYIAIVTGDYHVKVGVLLFEAEAILRAAPGAEPPFTIVSNAACKTSNKDLSPYFRAGGLIELAGNGKVAHALYYNKYDLKQWPPLS